MMSSRRSVLACIAAVLFVLGASGASATPVQYNFVSGTAMLDVEVNGIPITSLTAPVTGTFFTFDGMVPALTDLEILIDDTIDLGFLLGMLDVSVSVVDAAGFSAPAASAGPGSWTWAGGAFDVVADVVLSGGLAGFFSQQILATVPNASGTVDVSGNTATLHAQREAMFSFLHGGKTIEFFATIDFVGVPEPGTAGLLFAAAALAARRRVNARG